MTRRPYLPPRHARPLTPQQRRHQWWGRMLVALALGYAVLCVCIAWGLE